ncbi:hypothetical protein HK105_201354 [Polyrhizophydium stewartii]|uniref:Ankyrin repeat protein n=1 Tax=Polyrhizophydium stewartii TaxID=2732419 RepID=A0ABR4NHZ8_9FUNG
MAAASRFAGCADVADMLERLPFELGEAVYEHAGLTTQLLHGRLPLPLDDRTSALVWIDCMANDLVGCVPTLPQRNLTFEPYLAPPSDAMKSAIRARPVMALAKLNPKDSEDIVMKSALFSLETCRLLLRRELGHRATRPAEHWPKRAYASDWVVMVAAAGVGETTTMRRIIKADEYQVVEHDGVVLAAMRHDQRASIEELFPHLGHPAGLASVAIKNNAVECLDAIGSQFGLSRVTDSHIHSAVRDRRSGPLVWMIEHCSQLSEQQLNALVNTCVRYNRADYLRAIAKQGISATLDHGLAGKAAGGGDMKLIQLLAPHLVGDRWFSIAMGIAAGDGNLDAVRRLHLYSVQGAYSTAVANEDQGVARLEKERWIVCDITEAMDSAASNGHVDVLEFLHTERGAKCSFRALPVAAKRGDDRTVDWLLEWCSAESMKDMELAIFYAVAYKRRKITNCLITRHVKHTTERIAGRLLWIRWYDLAKIVIDSGHFVPSVKWLELALEARNAEIVELIKPMIEAHDSTPPTRWLHIATCYGNVEIVKLLIDRGARPDERFFCHFTPFGYFDVAEPAIELLFQRFPELDWQGYSEQRTWYSAGFAAFVKSLIEKRNNNKHEPHGEQNNK